MKGFLQKGLQLLYHDPLNIGNGAESFPFSMESKGDVERWELFLWAEIRGSEACLGTNFALTPLICKL